MLKRGLPPSHPGEILREDFIKENGVSAMFLEVRVSNAAARALYAQAGFREIGMRRGYYPARVGREDAVVLEYQP